MRAWLLPLVVDPTAQAFEGVRATTPVSWLAVVAEPGFALGATVQFVPFQRSTRVCLAKLLVMVVPTAQASVAEVAVTADRKVVPPPGSPVCSTVQLVPFQCSIRVWVVLLCEVRPTAHTLPADTAAT